MAEERFHTGNPRPFDSVSENAEERFWSKVDVGGPDECWEWQASTRSQMRYGSFRIDGRGVNAHRAAYRLEHGEVGRQLVLHHCDNPLCVNPDHLYLGDQSDNMKDAVRRGRIELPDNTGERNGNAKLTEEDVREIKHLLAIDEHSLKEIGDAFGVSSGAIWQIKVGETWTHVRLADGGGE